MEQILRRWTNEFMDILVEQPAYLRNKRINTIETGKCRFKHILLFRI